MKDKIMMLVFVLVLGTILTGILVAVNYCTTPVISRNEQREVQAGILQALGIPFAEEEVQQVFAGSVQARQAGGKDYFVAGEGAVAFAYAGSGLWGPINGIVALNPDLRTLKGVTILHQEETPGLGSRITEQAYLDTFRGKDFTSGLKLTPPGKARADNEIDAITGATLSPKAFLDILNANLRAVLPAIREGEKL
jgi:Na+-transporting NADH:ubiquinone oxidoreductase subunit C